MHFDIQIDSKICNITKSTLPHDFVTERENCLQEMSEKQISPCLERLLPNLHLEVKLTIINQTFQC